MEVKQETVVKPTIVIKDEEKDIKATISPQTEEGVKLSGALYGLSQEGKIPSNEDLDQFGDDIIQFFEESKEYAPDTKTEKIVTTAERVVSDIQRVVSEKNYDETIQDIAKKLQETTLQTPEDIPDVIRDEAERLQERLKNLLPLVVNLGRRIIKDWELRDLIITMIDVLQSTYSRISETGPSITTAIKEDIADTSKIYPSETEYAFREKAEEVKRTDLTEEEKEELINKAIRLFMKVKQRREYFEIFENIFSFYDEFVDIWNQVNRNAELMEIYHEASSILLDVRILIERSSGRSLDNWISYFQQLVKLSEDERFRRFRRDLEDLFLDRNNKFNTEGDIRTMFEILKDEIKELNEAYENVYDNIAQETKNIFYGISHDPALQRFRNDLNKLFREIFTDNLGRPTITATADSLKKLKDAFLPIIKQKLVSLALPMIEIESPKYYFKMVDCKFDDLSSLVPDRVIIESDSAINIDVNNTTRTGGINVRLRLENISVNIEKVKLALKKKTGIKYRTYGVVDVKVQDFSIAIEFNVHLEADTVDHIEFSNVNSDPRGIDIHVIESRRTALDKLLATLFLPSLRGRIKTLIDEKLYDVLKYRNQ